MADRNDDSGRYIETYPLEGFVIALEAHDGSASTREIADTVGCKYRTANAKLHELNDRGEVANRKVRNAYLWMLDPPESID